MSTEVHLAIYDLSRGMARTLSTQFFGPNHAIDIIPHTGIIAFGKEYLFGSMGIDCMSPHEFRSSHQIFPIQVQRLGHTQKTQEEFDDWCSSVTRNGLYDGNNYNLFHRNCNNFSHDAAIHGLGLDQGVPTWILETPNRFLSSPLGQMITPMLQQMQISGSHSTSNQQRWTQHRNASSVNNRSTPTIQNNNNHSNSERIHNPWANLNQNQNSNKIRQQDPIHNTVPSTTPTPILDSYNSTLLSKDMNSVILCIDKLLQNNYASSVFNDESTTILRQLKTDYLQVVQGNEMSHRLSIQKTTIECAAHCLISLLLLQQQQQQDHHNYETKNKSGILYTLIILRMVVLDIQDTTLVHHVLSNLSTLVQNTYNIDDDDDNIITSNTHLNNLSMLWCVMSNLIGSIQNHMILDPDLLMKVVDQAIGTLNAERYQGISQLRQMISSFLYNTAYYLTTHDHFISKNNAISENDDYCLDDGIMSLLCGTMEGLANECDTLTKLRRLMVMGTLLRPVNKTMRRHFILVKNLLLDLGFLDVLSKLLSNQLHDDLHQYTEMTELDKKMRDLSLELASLLSNMS